MTPAEWEEYRRRLELRETRRRDVRAAVGFTDAPPQPTRRRVNTRQAPETPAEHAGSLDRA